jgi:hypothetical protein
MATELDVELLEISLKFDVVPSSKLGISMWGQLQTWGGPRDAPHRPSMPSKNTTGKKAYSTCTVRTYNLEVVWTRESNPKRLDAIYGARYCIHFMLCTVHLRSPVRKAMRQVCIQSPVAPESSVKEPTYDHP